MKQGQVEIYTNRHKSFEMELVRLGHWDILGDELEGELEVSTSSLWI